MKIFILCLLGLNISVLQAQQLNDFQLTEMEKIYSDAHLYMFKPKFIENSDCFWYKRRNGNIIEYYWIDPCSRRKCFLFNDAFMRNELERLTENKLENYPVNVELEFINGGEKCFFIFEKGRYCYEVATQKLFCVSNSVSEDSLNAVWNQTKTHSLFVNGYNLFLRRNGVEEIQLTTNGERYYSYGVNDSEAKMERPNVQWLSDNKTFCGLRKDNRKNIDYSLMDVLASPRPMVHHYKSNMILGDTVSYQFWIGNTEHSKVREFSIKCAREEVVYFIGLSLINQNAFFLEKNQNSEHAKLIKMNLNNGTLDVLVDELFIMNETDVVMLEEGNKWLVRSDNTGLPHSYLYDGKGVLLRRITSGDWIAGPLLNIDLSKQRIYFCVYNHENVYGKVCSCDINKENHIKVLNDKKAFHEVSFSSSGKLLLDVVSDLEGNVNCLVYNSKGKLIYGLDLSDASEDVKPEYFRAPVLSEYVYGLIWKPLGDSLTTSYPVISYICPEQNIFTRSFFNSSVYRQIVQWVKWGFAVVIAKPNHPSVRLRKYTSEQDYILLSRLATSHKYLDVNKVGIYGKDRGGNIAVEAICKYPKFYQAAIAYGVDYLPLTREKKERLSSNIMSYRKGLLLITGDMNKENHPLNVYGLLNEFIDMGKNINLVVLPGQNEQLDVSAQVFYDYKVWSHWMYYLYDVHNKDIQIEFNVNNFLIK